MKAKLTTIPGKLKKHGLKTARLLLVVIFTAIFIRLFVGEPCYVASASMEPAILTGDWLWINKAVYGSRMPRRWADIPLINAFTHIARLRNADAISDWGYNRLSGYAQPQVGDIVVFNSPENEELLLIKRIAEIQQRGDTLFYCVRGDNAEQSHDSRFFGEIPEQLIVGKVNRTVISVATAGLKNPELRTDRIFKKLN
jgi:signal peptidase I